MALKQWVHSFTFFITLCLSAHSVKAQEADHQLWLNYALTVPVNSVWSYGGDIGIRGLVSNRNWNQIIVRPNVSYRFSNNLNLSAAMAVFNTFNKEDYNLFEYRIHQEVNAVWPRLKPLRLLYRFRAEQRWFFIDDEATQFDLRLRLLAGFQTKDIYLFDWKRPIYFIGLWEGFNTAGDENDYEVFVNQARVHIAFGHRVNKHFRYEVHYIMQRSRLFGVGDLLTEQHIFRIRFFHRNDFKSK